MALLGCQIDFQTQKAWRWWNALVEVAATDAHDGSCALYAHSGLRDR
jgi:hypothetical protein